MVINEKKSQLVGWRLGAIISLSVAALGCGAAERDYSTNTVTSDVRGSTIEKSQDDANWTTTPASNSVWNENTTNIIANATESAPSAVLTPTESASDMNTTVNALSNAFSSDNMTPPEIPPGSNESIETMPENSTSPTMPTPPTNSTGSNY